MSSDGAFKVFTLEIEGVSLDSVPLAEIGEYITDLASLLGRDQAPTFAGITKGSIKIKAKVPAERQVDVKDRASRLRVGAAPVEAMAATQRISQRLGKHSAQKASLLDAANNNVVEIPALPSPGEAAVPAIRRAGKVQGQIVRIGGVRQPVLVEIQDVDGYVYSCWATRDMAQRLAKEIFGNTIRAHGTGKWCSDGAGWRVQDFVIDRFDVLDDTPLDEALDELRNVRSAWRERPDPLAELEEIRRS